MVGFWSKEKNACCGKLIMKDFRKLNPRDFKSLYQLTRDVLESELIIFAPDGKCYVNSKKPGCEFAFSVFETLMRESTSTLEECRKEFLEKYPDINGKKPNFAVNFYIRRKTLASTDIGYGKKKERAPFA